MCTYATMHDDARGEREGPRQPAGSTSPTAPSTSTIPVHAMAEHTLNIDFADPARGPAARVAVELTAASARSLIAAIEAALESAPAALRA